MDVKLIYGGRIEVTCTGAAFGVAAFLSIAFFAEVLKLNFNHYRTASIYFEAVNYVKYRKFQSQLFKFSLFLPFTFFFTYESHASDTYRIGVLRSAFSGGDLFICNKNRLKFQNLKKKQRCNSLY